MWEYVIERGTWNAEEWEKIINYVDRYIEDYTYNSYDDVIEAHCNSESQYYALDEYLRKLAI